MFAKITVAALALALAAPAFAGTTATAPAVTCSKSAASSFKPKSDLIALLKGQGLTVVKIKTEKGCYEAYTKDAKGKKSTLGFNAETLEPVANAEAGEG
ncbi:PepSY domain-containing protein [bacterium]|nr:PepSY domain-containing protein [bacterium]